MGGYGLLSDRRMFTVIRIVSDCQLLTLIRILSDIHTVEATEEAGGHAISKGDVDRFQVGMVSIIHTSA